MIIFYEKLTGKITGTIEGRNHSEQQLNVWIGDKDTNDRIICNWKLSENKEPKPDNVQEDIFLKLDKAPVDVYKYIVDLQTKKLVLK